jgi:hypothetical protein
MWLCLVRMQDTSYGLMTVNKSFENVVKLKYFGTTVIDKSCIYEEMKSSYNSGSACYHRVQNFLSSRLF